MMIRWIVPTLLCSISLTVWAAAPDAANSTRRAPPPGLPISSADRAELDDGVGQLGTMIEDLRIRLKDKPALIDLLPDVLIFHKAVHWPLVYDEFLRSNDVAMAKTLLKQGLERAEALRGFSVGRRSYCRFL